ncbi:MAG: permease prefix domain 1-containing protein [Spirochaetaceae bacterium]|nr:permease prefix domain 1-containing protein [Spirochaetaceae bacterium]
MKEVEYYIRGLFRDVKQSPAIAEQREELTAHIIDRITDDVAQGLDGGQAFERAVAALGDLDELIDIITGRRKRVRVKRAQMISYLAGLCWGTAYMLLAGLWFASMGFGASALFVVIPGWLGYGIPFLFKFIDWRRNPHETEVIPLDTAPQLRRSLIAWIVISLACFAVNFIFSRGDTFLHVFWSWMPAMGVFTLPLIHGVYGSVLRRDKSETPALPGPEE